MADLKIKEWRENTTWSGEGWFISCCTEDVFFTSSSNNFAEVALNKNEKKKKNALGPKTRMHKHIAEPLGSTACWLPSLVSWCLWCWGVASFLKVWVFDLVPYSPQLKSSPISNSFRLGVFWCDNCFNTYSVWCFAIGTFYSYSVLSFSPWLYNSRRSY